MARAATRDDILPVVIAGDIGAYALGREMHEAYGLSSICVAPQPIGAIEHSRIFSTCHVERLDGEHLRGCLTDIATKNPGRKVLVLSNADPLISTLSRLAPQLPQNVVMCMPPAEVADLVSDKIEFARLCAKAGLETPETVVAHVEAGAAAPRWQGDFPVVVKPARSPEYAALIARGFKKVYYLGSQEELDQVVLQLAAAGFVGDMLVQELVAGDDTYMDSITLYLDRAGRCTLYGSAHVLLEDHAPAMLGNPVAMITQQVPDLWEKSAALLAGVGYRGFANFDVKRDPKRPGRYVFLEVNPRIGRNSYYNLAAGANPVQLAVADMVDGQEAAPLVAASKILYTLVPVSLLRRYVRDPALLAEVDALVAKKLVFDPQRYRDDWSPRRRMDVILTEKNQVRKFARYYPEPTDTSF